MCVQGIFEFPEVCHDLAHLIPADKVNEVLAWSAGLDPKFAVLNHKTRFIGIWWKHASRDSIQELVPKCSSRHTPRTKWGPRQKTYDELKLCAFIMPVGHAAYRAVPKAKTGDHYFCSQISLPTAGMRVVNVN